MYVMADGWSIEKAILPTNLELYIIINQSHIYLNVH